jgi:hypothetical protein
MYIDMVAEMHRPLIWMGSSRRDLRGFPQQVRRDMDLIHQRWAEVERVHRERQN